MKMSCLKIACYGCTIAIVVSCVGSILGSNRLEFSVKFLYLQSCSIFTDESPQLSIEAIDQKIGKGETSTRECLRIITLLFCCTPNAFSYSFITRLLPRIICHDSNDEHRHNKTNLSKYVLNANTYVFGLNLVNIIHHAQAGMKNQVLQLQNSSTQPI